MHRNFYGTPLILTHYIAPHYKPSEKSCQEKNAMKSIQAIDCLIIQQKETARIPKARVFPAWPYLLVNNRLSPQTTTRPRVAGLDPANSNPPSISAGSAAENIFGWLPFVSSMLWTVI
jgi:hypothetical protein